MPFAGYKITSPYGMRKDPFSGLQKFHTGIDLVKADKAPIFAFTAGEVLFAGAGKTGTGLGGYGLVVVIKDKNGRAQLYAHLDRVVVKVGTIIEKGQLVGYQGSTGQVTGSHLHYEVRKKTAPSYGWEADRANNCIEPTAYLQAFFLSEKENAVGKQKVYLPKTDSSWRVYPLNKVPVKGNEKGFLNPKKFGGLTYDIIGNPQKDVYTIQTKDFGKGNIYAAQSTGAIVK